MADKDGTLVSDAEIEAALEQAAREVNIPTLDDDGGVVPIPVPVQAGAQPVATAHSIGDLESPPPDDELEDHSYQPPPGVGPIYRIVDQTLWAINRPFVWLRPETRQTVGVIAIVTIVVAVAASILLPKLLPNRHFLTDLKARSHAVAQPPVAESEEPAAAP